MRTLLRIGLVLTVVALAIPAAAEGREPERMASVATLPGASATAVIDLDAEDRQAPSRGISFGLALGAMTSNPWRGDQLAPSNTEPFWMSVAELSGQVGPGTLGVGFAAIGPSSGAYAEFGIPVTYTLSRGAWETALVYEAMPTTTSPASEVVHEFGTDLSVAAGPLVPFAAVRFDPTVERGVYANTGVQWAHERGRFAFDAGALLGVSAYVGVPFGAQHADTILGSSVAFSGGLGARLEGVLSYGFRAAAWLPYGSVALTYER
jgi:hypothetical protein